MVSSDNLCVLAGPFRHINDVNTSGYLWILLSAFSALITASLRFLVLGYCFSALPLQSPDQATAPLCPRCQQQSHTSEGDDPELLPFSESNSSSEEILAEAKARISRPPSITRFVICTAISIISIITMVLLACNIQSLVCLWSPTTDEARNSRAKLAIAISLWFIYTFSVGWAGNGILCWVIWLRNLWGGPEAAEKWPIQHDICLIIVFFIYVVPLALALGLAFLPLVVLVRLVILLVKGLGKWVGRSLHEKERKVEAIKAESVVGYNSGDITEEEGKDSEYFEQ